MKTLFSLLVAIPLLMAAAPTPSSPVCPGRTTLLFPNGCAVLASQVTGELRRSGCRAEILFVAFFGKEQGHALAVWQPFPGSPVLVFDHTFLDCTVNLSLHSMSDPQEIVKELNKRSEFAGKICRGFFLR